MEQRKLCTKCGRKKALSRFHKAKRNKFGVSHACKSCRSTQAKCNRRGALLREHARRNAIRALLTKLKDVPCTDCGDRYHYCVMDFDHLPQFTKSFNLVTAVARKYSLDRIRGEAAKCEVVCANCHRLRTFGRTNDKTKKG